MWLQPSGAVPLLSDLHLALVLSWSSAPLTGISRRRVRVVTPTPLMHKTHHHFLRAAGEVAGVRARSEMFGRPPRSLLCAFSYQAAGPVGSRRGRCHQAVRVTAGAFDAASGSTPPTVFMSIASGVQVLPVHLCGGGMRFRRCGSGWRLLRGGAFGSAGSRSLAGSGHNGRAKGVWARVAGWRLPGGQPLGPAIDPPLQRHPFFIFVCLHPLFALRSPRA